MLKLVLLVATIGIAYLSTFTVHQAYEVFFAWHGYWARSRRIVKPHREMNWNQIVKDHRLATANKSPENNRNKPNIVLIVADDLGINDLYGHHYSYTSNIRSIATSGVNFTQAYAGHATCSPSRAAILTGQFSTRFGFEFTPIPAMLSKTIDMISTVTKSNQSNKTEAGKRDSTAISSLNMSIPIDVPMLPEILQEDGYNTYFIGKWHLGQGPGRRPHERGFDHSLGFLPGAAQYLGHDNRSVGIEARVSASLLDVFLWEYAPYSVSYNGGEYFAPNEYMTDYLANQAVDIIRAEALNNDEPFFLELAFNAPHNPLHALLDDFNKISSDDATTLRARVYAAMILALDRGVGSVLQALRDTNQFDDTLIIFTSDNGGANYLGLTDINAPFRGWKATLFEGGIRVPMFMSWPKRIKSNAVMEYPVGHVDIFSTVVDAAHINRRKHTTDGASLLPYVEIPEDDAIVDGHSQIVDLEPPHKALYWRSGHYSAVRVGNWKLQMSNIPSKLWLFDLDIDPTEKNNYAEAISGECVLILQAFLLLSNINNGTVSSIFPEASMKEPNNQQKSDLLKATKNSNVVCHETLIASMDPSVLSVLQHTLEILAQINREQHEPLWPSSSDTKIYIDQPVCAEDQGISSPNYNPELQAFRRATTSAKKTIGARVVSWFYSKCFGKELVGGATDSYSKYEFIYWSN